MKIYTIKINTLLMAATIGLLTITIAHAQDETVNVTQLIRDSQSALTDGDMDRAQQLSEKAIEMDPAYPAAWRQLGVTLQRLGKAEEAVKAFRRAVDIDVDDIVAWRGLATAFSQLGQFDDAVLALRSVVAGQPDNASAWNDLAVALAKQSQWSEAAQAFRKVTQLQPDNASAWRGLADVLARLNREDEAIVALSKAVAIHPQDAAAWRELGLLYQKRHNRPEAIAAFQNVLRHRADDHATQRDLGWLLWEEKQRDEGLKHLSGAVRGGIDAAAEVVFQVVARLGEEGLGAQALKFMREVDPHSSPADRAVDLVRADRVKAALPILQTLWSEGTRTTDVGVNLAYARTKNGQFDKLHQYLDPLLNTSGKCTDEHAELAIEALWMSAGEVDAAELVVRLEKKLANESAHIKRISDIMEVSAERFRIGGNPEKALRIYRDLIKRNPDKPCWIWVVLLTEEIEKQSPLAWMKALEQRSSDPSVRLGVSGVRADRNGNDAQAVGLIRNSLDINPEQPALRKILFVSLLNQGRIDEARRETQWFAQRVAAGDKVLRSYLAELLSAQGDHQSALEQWTVLRQDNPDSAYYVISTAADLVELDRPTEAIAVLNAATATIDDHRLYEALAEISSSVGDYQKAVEWSEEGLKLHESQTLLRLYAESLEALQTDAQPALTAARKFLKTDPGHVPMTLLAGRMLEATAATNSVLEFHNAQLERNPYFTPSLQASRAFSTKAGLIDDAVKLAQRRAEIQPYNTESWRLYANSMAEKQQYRQALGILSEHGDIESKDVLPVLVYASPAGKPYAGRNSIEQISEHISHLAAEGYKFINSFDTFDNDNDNPQIMLVLIDPSSRVIETLDEVLHKHQARVVYAGNSAVPELTLKGHPLTDKAAAILRSDRWNIASGVTTGVLRRKIAETEELLGNVMTHPLQTPSGAESEADYAQRIERDLQRSAQPLKTKSERILVYPAGDYGQLSLDMHTNNFEILRRHVAASYTHAIHLDSNGFFVKSENSDNLRIPARSVPPRWNAQQLSDYLNREHPLALIWLERGRILYWNGQHEAAHRAFAQAEKHGADPAEVNFNWGMNSYMQGDLPTARAKLLSAQAHDPENELIPLALDRVNEKRRAQATVYLFGWEDNEDRDYFKYGGNADMFISERIRVGVLADRNRWQTDGIGSEYGTRYGVRALTYLAPQIWFSGSLWQLNMDDIDNIIGGDAALRLPNPWLNGSITPSFSRDEIETVEALRAEIYAETYRLGTYTRLMDVFDLYADVMQITRSDNNDTTLLDGRLLYRVSEWPYLGIGWRFRIADSDRDPPEYWAPEELQQHMLHITLRGEWQRLSGFVSAEAGYAKERDTNWEFVWSARSRGTLALTSSLDLFGEIRWTQSPNYERLQGLIGARAKF